MIWSNLESGVLLIQKVFKQDNIFMFAGHYTFIQFWGNKFKELEFHEMLIMPMGADLAIIFRMCACEGIDALRKQLLYLFSI